ncbi:hypothetical protein SLEP1_g53303 [Rubroshorea leprosula]|uniref:Uncharacterized protein n=1 Tax=Rubroshorea leprosula TaxID=152421 RepID=A0AAV5M904_9ROSI|nr:hypothetical protein SLEP1_g53303 [Rubroshorea leprosula]
MQLLLERGTNLEAKDEMVQFLYTMFVQEVCYNCKFLLP